MRKSILLLSSVGIGAGLLYALGFNRRNQQKTENSVTDELEKVEHSSGRESSVASHIGESGSANDMPKRPASMARIVDAQASLKEKGTEPAIDDRGTDQSEASQILKNIRDTAFDASDEKLALALGRPTDEIEEWTSGAGMIDGDVVMKARALAIQRGLEVE